MPKVKIEKAKPVGRPPVDPDLKRVPIGLSIDFLVKKELVKIAKKRGASVSVVANEILKDALI